MRPMRGAIVCLSVLLLGLTAVAVPWPAAMRFAVECALVAMLAGALAWGWRRRYPRDLEQSLRREIAERKHAESTLWTSELRYKTLFDASIDAVVLMTSDGEFLGANRAALALYGCKKEKDLLLCSPAALSPEYQPDGTPSAAAAERVMEITQREGSHQFEWTHKRLDGTEFLASVTLTKMDLDEGPLLLATMRNITEQRRSQTALRISERRLRLFAENVDDVLWTVDASGRYTYFSPSVEQMLGIKWDEGMEVTIADVATPASLEVARKTLTEIMVEAQAGQRPKTRTIELELLRVDGSTVWAEIAASAMYDESGKVIGALGVARDLTLRKQLEDELRKAKDTAEAATHAKSRFLAAMSHDIRTPMTSILGYADLLLNPKLDSSHRHNYAAAIRRSGEHLLTLINDILDLSKIEAGKMSLDVRPSSVVSLLADVASVARPRAESNGVSFSIEYAGELPETILTDSARLRQAMVNLASNAVKFTEKGSVRIVVSFLPDGCNGQPGVRFEVIDTGIGIRKNVLPELFQPFNQGNASISQRFGGTGLGLAISQHIAHLLGGELGVTSVWEQGSTFTLTVPTGSLEGIVMLECPSEVEHETAGRVWQPGTEDLRGVRILLAEDGFDNRELIGTVLQTAGAEIETAENGRLAVNKVESSAFDVILMDMNMPEMDGYEATSLLRDRGYRGPIFALTANAMSDDYERCVSAGCDEYLTKPIDRALLIRTIANRVDKEAVAGRRSEHREGAGVKDVKPEEILRSAQKDKHVQDDRHAQDHARAEDNVHALDDSREDASVHGDGAIVSQFINDPDMMPIIRGFVGRLPHQLDTMRQALADGKYEELRRLAHTLKGAGGSYGYPLLTEACKALESIAKSQDDAAADPALDNLAVLICAIENGCFAETLTGETL